MDELNALIELLASLITDLRFAALSVLLILASISDYRTHRIPNWLTFGGAAFGLVYSALFPFSIQHGFLGSLSGLILGCALMLPLYAFRVMGAGDVKLMGMIGAFVGVYDIAYVVVATFIVGGAAALIFALVNGVSGRMLGNVKAIAEAMMVSALGGTGVPSPVRAGNSVGRMPYGVSISIAAIGYIVAAQLGYL